MITKKRYIQLISLAVLLFIGIILYIFYPKVNLHLVNKQIYTCDVKLAMYLKDVLQMPEEKLETQFEGRYAIHFKNEKLLVSFPDTGEAQDRVSMIRTENPNHRILGIHVGNSYEQAVSLLKEHGFRSTNIISLFPTRFKRGNIIVSFSTYLPLKQSSVKHLQVDWMIGPDDK